MHAYYRVRCPLCDESWLEKIVRAHDLRWYYVESEIACPNCKHEPEEIDLVYEEEI